MENFEHITTHPVSSRRAAGHVVKPRYRRPGATGVPGGYDGVMDRGEGEAGRVGGRAAVDAADSLGATPKILQIGDAAVTLELAEGDVVHREPEEGALRGTNHIRDTLLRYS